MKKPLDRNVHQLTKHDKAQPCCASAQLHTWIPAFAGMTDK